MLVKEFFASTNLSTVSMIKINGTEYTFYNAITFYGEIEINFVEISASMRTLMPEDIKYLYSVDAEEVRAAMEDVEVRLPLGAQFICIEINIRLH